MNARVAQFVEHRLKHDEGCGSTIGTLSNGVETREDHTDNSFGANPLSRTNHYKWHLYEWRQEIGEPIYMTRWMLDLRLFSIRLHKFHRSDDDRALHDHAWSFITFIIAGGYWDVTKSGREWLGPGSIRYRSNEHRHTIEVPQGRPSWSLIITGPHKHRWGFYIKNSLGNEKFVNSQRYFRKFGHH